MHDSTVRFGAFEADLQTEELRKHGHRRRLPRQSFQVLAMLLREPGRLVTRAELRSALWPGDTFVEFDHGLNAAVNRLREALGDSADTPRFIETLPRRGYRFIGQITPLAPAQPAPEAPRALPPARVHRRWAAWAAATVMLILLAGAVAWRSFDRQPPYRIAVLPFTNGNAQPGSDYVAEVLTAETIHDLSMIDGLRVTSRTSSSMFSGTRRDLREIARQLSVNLILEAAVQHEGSRLLVNVDLVRVPEDSTFWSRRYESDVNDLQSVEAEISRDIVNELRLKHIGGRRRYDVNADVYELYLRAESVAGASVVETGRQAIALYEQALAKDPRFAPAYAGLATVYARLRLPGAAMPDADRRMREAALKAMQLDPTLAEAHAARGIVQAADKEWSEAERSFQHALQLDPNAAIVHQQFGMLVLMPEGRIAAAVQQFREELDLDPLSNVAGYSLAFGLSLAGAYDEALERCRPLMATNPADEGILQVFARSLWFTGKQDDAIRVLQPLDHRSHGFLGFFYAQTGRRDEALRLANEPDPAATRHQALIAAGLGDKDGVFDALRKMAAENDFGVDLFPFFPEFALVRDDPRMTALRHERHLPWPL